jgi:hypothetical protein
MLSRISRIAIKLPVPFLISRIKVYFSANLSKLRKTAEEYLNVGRFN